MIAMFARCRIAIAVSPPGRDRATQRVLDGRLLLPKDWIPTCVVTTKTGAQSATARIRPRAMVIVLPKSQGKPNLTNRGSARQTETFPILRTRAARPRLRLLHRDA
ncbi:hypothetical protein [Bradyrhizobium tunisiense]|uniref:hypothetical protein n=1 Tax=Bradyrhizobium tunisiense TaxID=3278709 RepID=UPI001BA52371|nr:hypothetical protein [Bradyrhizobium diazoefficiens]